MANPQPVLLYTAPPVRLQLSAHSGASSVDRNDNLTRLWMRPDLSKTLLRTTVDYDSGLVPSRSENNGAQERILQHRVLGDFALGEVLGRGGFGTVHRAVQRGLGRAAVVKVVHASLTDHREAAERFMLEAQLAARFQHPYAAHIYSFGVEPDRTMWLAMELVDGVPLSDLVAQSGPLELDRFMPFFERLCDVVQAAHDQGIVHRDIKPSNVMVVAQGGRLIPKLLDFGIAKVWLGDEDIKTSTIGTTMAPDSPDGFSCSRSLTRDGQFLGSPPYMAPEQWGDASTAGPAADQYALALLAYEVLTGAPPFAGSTTEVLAHQHQHDELPALPGHVPEAVHQVLVRASYKTPTDRYPKVTDFASALRIAALGPSHDVDERTAALPTALTTRWLAEAPRPLAEAIAALIGVRSAARTADRIHALGALLVRWIGIMAIACRSRIGKLDDPESPEAVLLMTLRRRPLLDGEWLDLAVALCRLCAHRPELWPVPDMAAFLASEPACRRLRALLRDPTSIAGINLQTLDMQITELLVVLEELDWLCGYVVAREDPDGFQIYRGLRSGEIVVRTGLSRGNGELVLLDADGGRVIRISPLMRVAPPAPGDPEEVFFLAGPGRTEGAARFASYPHGFECDDDQLWAWLAAHVLEAAPSSTATRTDDRSPYPGLAAYRAEDRESFVGRERDVETLLNRLRTQSLITVIGPSGVGKTSFLAAGLIPALGSSWLSMMIRPGSQPLATLAAIAAPRDASRYREDPSSTMGAARELAAGLAATAQRSGRPLAIIIDQAEELFTLCPAESRATFAEALTLAATSPGIRVVVAMRDDFLCRAEELPAWRDVLCRCVQVLRTPSRDELERIVIVPAHRHGFDFDDSRLPADIATEVVDRPGALSLIAFAAAELWQRRDRHFRRLTRAAYEHIGGVAGALVQHADAVVDRMPASDRRLVRIAFRRLLTSEGARAVLTRAELESALGGSTGAAVIDRLLDARLIVSREADLGDRIEIIHETLATMWPRLASWRREDADGARLQEQLAAAARSWDARHRPGDLLWRGNALVDLVRWCESAEHHLGAIEDAFVSASRRAAARSRRRRVTAITTTFAILLAGIVGLVWANRMIGEQRSAAIDRLARSFEERGRLAIADRDHARALLYLAEASRLGARGPSFDVIASHAVGHFDAGLQVLGRIDVGILQFEHDSTAMFAFGADRRLWRWNHRVQHLVSDGVYCFAQLGDLSLAVSIDGKLTATDAAGNRRWQVTRAVSQPDDVCTIVGSTASNLVISLGTTAKLWDASTGEARGELRHDKDVVSVALNASGSLIATGDVAGGVRLWRASDATLVATCESHAAQVRTLKFAADSSAVASGDNDGTIRVCDAVTGATIHRLIGHHQSVLAIDVAPDGRTMVSSGRDGRPRIWNAQTGALVSILDGHEGAVLVAAYSSDGKRIVTLGMDGTARVWDPTGMALAILPGHGGPILAGSWDDNTHVITASFDGVIRRWDVQRATKAMLVHAHGARIRGIAVSSHGRWVLTGSDDGFAVLWDRGSGQAITRLRPGSRVTSVAFGPRDATALTVDASRATLWTLPDGVLRATFPRATAGVFAPDGTVITAGDGRVTFWSAEGTERGSVACDYAVQHLILDPGRRWLFVRGNTSAIQVIDLLTRESSHRLVRRDNGWLSIAADVSHVAITDGTTVRLWWLGTWLPAGELTGHKGMLNQVWFLPSGQIVSSAFDGAFVWERNQLTAKLAGTSQMYALATSPSGGLFATTGTDGSVRVWDSATYLSLLKLPSHRSAGSAVQFTPDGEAVISGGTDGRLAIWSLAHRTRTTAELAEIVRCRVPLRLVGDAVLPRGLDYEDPSCQNLAFDP